MGTLLFETNPPIYMDEPKPKIETHYPAKVVELTPGEFLSLICVDNFEALIPIQYNGGFLVHNREFADIYDNITREGTYLVHVKLLGYENI